ncbi:multi-sensor signal transduction histidine kinase [Thioalkalivibrio sp. K90mix]|uniref:sensor histidine kinase n=1 Tax=Thioalkalivibrio sp. (strain K90mix) TaxID=396595 RepID=UPI000195A59C|nr:sensor histidine kinase [Thioalkalivibrio sp. K90mix]ADC71364.1 multi-sensor signal transduction histidine kinase [Thioalkalivibrio sp. K90mix]
MTLSLGLIYAVGVAYLALLFGIAFLADRVPRIGRIAANSWVFSLSLGVYATSWTFYGNLGFLADHGYLYLTIYLGVTLAFAATPWLLRPILRLTREQQLTSLADLFAFRYRSRWTGPIVALFMLSGVLPYIALQIKAVAESAGVLTAETPPHLLALTFSATIALFAILFGARHIAPREKHAGLVLAIAFESIVKLLAILGITAVALYAVFGGFSGLDTWLTENPEAVDALYAPVREGGWFAMMILAFAAAFLLPRQFHMLFTENINPAALNRAAWAFPAFLLLLNLPMPVLYWAGEAAGLGIDTNYYAIGIAGMLDSPSLALLVFIGGLSAASAMMIVTTLALAHMGTNYLSPLTRLHDEDSAAANLYSRLLWGRRLWIVFIIGLGYAFYGLLQVVEGLAQLGLISFAAVAQLLPGLIGLMLWKQANRVGFLLGLGAGITGWLLTLVLPLMAKAGIIAGYPDPQAMLRAEALDPWTFALMCSLGINAVLFVLGSLLTRPNREETEAGRACCPNESAGTGGGLPLAGDVTEMETALAATLGASAARHEVQRALDDLGLPRHTRSRGDLRTLRERIERNLSGLLGPVLARMIVDQHLRLDAAGRHTLSESLRRVEEQLETRALPLSGLAAELDALRRFHRQILHELPLGVASLGTTGEITGWNQALAKLTAISTEQAVGCNLQQLESPWAGLLTAFIESPDRQWYKLNVDLPDGNRRLNLHKSALQDEHGRLEGRIVLIEDITERAQLESEIAHGDRLASIGRFAAGVAHEIGNPLTGIASLAQNLPLEQDPEEVRGTAEDILAQTRRINAIVQSLVTFAHADEGPSAGHFETIALDAIVQEAIRLTRLAGRKDLRFDLDGLEGHYLRGSHATLLQVFINLLTNAEQASPENATVSISASARGRNIHLIIDDRGPGIEESSLERLFEPFFTTKPAGHGTGLGLPVAYSIVRDHGGTLMAANRPEGGARFILILPRHKPDGDHA